MKTLLLLRHAKSSWDDPSQRDFDRPLAPRGIRDAPRIGSELTDRGPLPDLIISSPAKRATQTIELVARAADVRTAPTFEDLIYGASSAELLALVRKIPDVSNCALLVGHNPAFEELLSRLSKTVSKAAPIHMPTCSLARLDFPVDHWNDIEDDQGELVWLVTPKELK